MPTPTTDGPPVAQEHAPSVPRWAGADVLRHSGAPSCAASRVPPSPHKVLHAVMACRTAALGGHAAQCAPCGFERDAYNACRHRHGPTCHTLTKAQWVADRQAELLPVPYFHGVLTLPHALKALVLANKRPLLTLLLRAASPTLLQCGRQNLGGQLGGIQVLPTWEQTLGPHCHGHCLVPGGALAEQGTRWTPTHPQCFLPVHALGPVFRSTCLDALHECTTTDAVVCPEETPTRATPQGFRRFPDQLSAKAWIVSAKRSMAGPGPVLDSLSRSTPRVALATHRIVDVYDGPVHFPSRNRRQGHRGQTMTLEAHAGLRRFLVPVLPHGVQRLRHIGFLANRCKARALRQGRPRLDQAAAPPTQEKKTVAQWMAQCTNTDITRGPHCGHGPLQRTPLPALPLRAGSLSPPPSFDSS